MQVEQHPLEHDSQAATRQIREWQDVTPEVFEREIVPRQEPAVLRGLARDWRLLAAWKTSPEALVDYLIDLDNNQPVVTVTAPADVRGRLGYEEGGTAFNHRHAIRPLPDVLHDLLEATSAAEPPAIWIGGLSADKHLPGLRAENDTALAPTEAEPHLTICNSVTIPAHIDSADNIAIVVAGRRRFTVFPPEQVANLYIGPLDPTPAGVPISLVSQDAPDFERFPRFRDALAAGFVADLDPGDAIYIPYLWWHGVQSLDRFNMLVNFWWYSHQTGQELPWIPLLNMCHQLFAGMPAAQRGAWQALFDYWVFARHGDPADHLSPTQRAPDISLDKVAAFRDQVAAMLVR